MPATRSDAATRPAAARAARHLHVGRRAQHPVDPGERVAAGDANRALGAVGADVDVSDDQDGDVTAAQRGEQGQVDAVVALRRRQDPGELAGQRATATGLRLAHQRQQLFNRLLLIRGRVGQHQRAARGARDDPVAGVHPGLESVPVGHCDPFGLE